MLKGLADRLNRDVGGVIFGFMTDIPLKEAVEGYSNLPEVIFKNPNYNFQDAFKYACTLGKPELLRVLVEWELVPMLRNIEALTSKKKKNTLVAAFLERQSPYMFEGKNRGIFDIFAELGIPDLDFAKVMFAAETNDMAYIRQFAIQHDANDLLVTAANNGYWDMFEYAMQLGADDWEDAFIVACEAAQMEIIEYLLGQGITHYNLGIYEAARGGHADLCLFLLDKQGRTGPPNYLAAFRGACKGGKTQIIQMMVDRGVSHWDLGLDEATRRKGNIETVRFLVEKGATNLNDVLVFATAVGDLEVLRFLEEKGATHWEWALEESVRADSVEVMDFIVSRQTAFDREDYMNLIDLGYIYGSVVVLNHLLTLQHMF